MTVVAIHQPNFFPWLGYFDKIHRSDVFVFLDDVQYQKTGGAWSNRVRVLMQGQAQWLTAPVDRVYHGTRQVDEVRFSANVSWRGRLRKTLQSAYGRAIFYRQTMDLLNPLLDFSADNVADYNINSIGRLMQALGLEATRCVRSSSIPTASAATKRLVEITAHLGGTHYLCGGGSGGYQQDEMFAQAGICLVHQQFVHPQYAQPGVHSFVPGLSVMDALMHRGALEVAACFRAAIVQPRGSPGHSGPTP